MTSGSQGGGIDAAGFAGSDLFGRSGLHRSLAHEPGVTVVGLRDLFAADLEYER